MLELIATNDKVLINTSKAFVQLVEMDFIPHSIMRNVTMELILIQDVMNHVN